MIRILALLIFLTPAFGGEFKSLKIDYAAKAKYVERLSEVRISKITIDKINLSAAISMACRGDNKEGEPPIVSYVVSFPTRVPNADPFSDDPVEKAKIDPLVSYQGKDVGFTTVLDSLCTQAGYIWSVADDGKGQSFILVEYK